MSIYGESGGGKHVNPSDKRKVKNSKKSFKMTGKSIKPVSNDTNNTRRKMVKPTKSPTIVKGKM